MTLSSRDSATYVFCIVRSKRTPSLRGVPASLPGAGDVRLLPIEGDLWAAVADAPLDRFSAEQIERDLQDIDRISRLALAHAAVIEYFFRRSPVVPLKLLTLFTTDERAVAHLRRRRAALRRLLARLRGLEEWGVRITVEAAPPSSGAPVKAPSSGRQYLEIKKRLRDRPPAQLRGAREATKAISALGRLAARERREKFPFAGADRPRVAGVSFLVRADRRASWKARAAQLKTALAKDGNRLELSGPWAPYHFVTGR